MPTQAEIQESITNRIIEGLQNGLIPWRKPWMNDPNCGAAAILQFDQQPNRRLRPFRHVVTVSRIVQA